MVWFINILKPTGNSTYQKVQYLEVLRWDHMEFVGICMDLGKKNCKFCLTKH